MELILWLLVSYYLANNLVTNTAYAVRGLDPPRHKERMARIENGGQAPAGAYRSGRHGASRFFAEAWHDAWDDAHGKRQALREKRHAKSAERTEGSAPDAQPDGAVDTPGALRPQDAGEAGEPGENVIPLASRRAAARTAPVAAAAGATRTASASTAAGGAPHAGGTATEAPPRPTDRPDVPDPSGSAGASPSSSSSDDVDWDDWREPTHCEHCPADDGPGGTVRLRLDVTPSGDLCDECYGRRRAAEADPDGPANQPVTCPLCGEDRRRYDLDRVSLYGGEPEPACPDCIQLAAVKRPRRYSHTDPTAESADWPDAAPARSEPSPQPDGLLDSPSALRPAGNEPDPRPNPQPRKTHASSGDPYPSLFTTAANWEAHQATLTPEVRRTYDALCARAAAADGEPVPISLAEQAALLQARGYAPDVAQQAAEDIHARARLQGGAVMIGGFRRLAGEDADRWTPGQHEQPSEPPPAADRGGAAPSQETQEGNRMSVMTSNNATGQPTGETAGLGSAIRFAEGMAGSMRDAASRTETSVASLTGSEVGAGPIAALQQAMEAATNAAAAFEHARAELEKQLTVKEAYDATPDAGNKQFLQSD